MVDSEFGKTNHENTLKEMLLNHRTDVLLYTNFALGGAILIEFSRVVENQIHEGVKATEDTLDLQIKVS